MCLTHTHAQAMESTVVLRLAAPPVVTTTTAVETRIDVADGLLVHGEYKFLVGTSRSLGIGWCFQLKRVQHSHGAWRKISSCAIFFKFAQPNVEPGVMYTEDEEDRLLFRPTLAMPDDTVWTACVTSDARRRAIDAFVAS